MLGRYNRLTEVMQDTIQLVKEASEKSGAKWNDAWQTLQDYVKKVPRGKEVLIFYFLGFTSRHWIKHRN